MFTTVCFFRSSVDNRIELFNMRSCPRSWNRKRFRESQHSSIHTLDIAQSTTTTFSQERRSPTVHASTASASYYRERYRSVPEISILHVPSTPLRNWAFPEVPSMSIPNKPIQDMDNTETNVQFSTTTNEIEDNGNISSMTDNIQISHSSM